MKVLVCGSREFNNEEFLFEVLDNIHRETIVTDIIDGAAKGADSLGFKWATLRRREDDRFIRTWRFPADWKKFGKAAGSRRNQQMLDEGKPDLVVAFPLPGSVGTWDMVNRAEKAGIEVRIYEEGSN